MSPIKKTISHTRLSKSKWFTSVSLANLLMMIVGITLFVVLLRHISFKEFTEVLSHADMRYLSIAVLAGIASTVVRTIRYGYFFLSRVQSRWLTLYGTFALLRFLYFILPFRSGEFVSLGILKKNQLSPSIAETLPVWMLLRITDLTALSILFAFVLSVSGSSDIFDGKMQLVRWLLISISTISVVFILWLAKSGRKFGCNYSNNWISKRLFAIRTGLDRLKSFRVFTRTLFFAMLIWGLLLTTSVFAQISFNTPLHYLQCMMVSLIVLSISLLPIHPPMSIGTGETAWVAVMVMTGVPLQQAIPLAISIRLVSVSLILVEGFIGLILCSANKRNSGGQDLSLIIKNSKPGL